MSDASAQGNTNIQTFQMFNCLSLSDVGEKNIQMVLIRKNIFKENERLRTFLAVKIINWSCLI